MSDSMISTLTTKLKSSFTEKATVLLETLTITLPPCFFFSSKNESITYVTFFTKMILFTDQ